VHSPQYHELSLCMNIFQVVGFRTHLRRRNSQGRVEEGQYRPGTFDCTVQRFCCVKTPVFFTTLLYHAVVESYRGGAAARVVGLAARR